MTIDKLFLSIHTHRFAYVVARSSISGTLVAIRNAIKGINRTVSHTSSSIINATEQKAYIELRAPYHEHFI
jgi:hypothetical protein